MPPHIFHALSDDPARWERQFGCMAALFQMLDHHPRFFRRRPRPPSYTNVSSASASAAANSHSKTSNKPAAAQASAKPVVQHNRINAKDGHIMQDTKASSCTAKRRTSERGGAVPGRLQEAAAPSSTRLKNESPSILHSSRATHTIREPPRKSFDGSTSPADDHCRTNTPAAASSARSRSLPGSPHVRVSNTRDHTRSQFSVQKPLSHKPRVSSDGGQLLPAAAASRVCHSHRDQSYCKDPLQELEESIRALAKIQQATQKLVDGFEVRQNDLKLQAAADEPAKKSHSGNNWWNAGKARFFQKSHGHAGAAPQNSSAMEAAAAGRTSSFDYTEAVRISQKIQETPARLSLDGRELVPKAVMKLREAMRLGSTPVINTSACKSSGVADKGLQRSNIIARLMGLDDLPRTTARQDVCKDAGNTTFKEARPLKDLLRCADHPPPADCSISTDHSLKNRPMVRFYDHPRPADCSINTTDHPLKDLSRFDDHPHPADCYTITQKPIRQYDAAIGSKSRKIGVLSRELDDCKVINEVNTETNSKNSCTLNDRPAVILSKHALEVMPSPSLIRKRRGAVNYYVEKDDRAGREIEKVNVYKNDPGAVAGFESRPVEVQEKICSIVVMKPRKIRTLSMETHFPFDDPSIDKAEYADQLPTSCSDHRPKLQATAAAGDNTRQRDMANQSFDHKHKHLSPPKSNPRKGAVKNVGNDQSYELIAIAEPAAAATGSARYRKAQLKQRRAAAASTDSENIKYNETKQSLSRFSGGGAALSAAGAGAGAGCSKANNIWQGRQGDGQTVRMRTAGLVRADNILERAEQLCVHSHGSCTDREQTTSSSSRRSRGGHASILEKRCAAGDSLNSVSQGSTVSERPSCLPSTLAVDVHTQPPPSAPNIENLTSRGGKTDVPISVFERPHVDNNELAAAEEGFLNGKFEYVEAILERAGLLADKEDAVVQSHHLAQCALRIDPAIFLEMERSWPPSSSPPPSHGAVTLIDDGRQRRRLVFDCVHEILTENSFRIAGDGRCNRGLLLAVWEELKRLVVVVPSPPPPTPILPTPTNKPVRLCWVLARQTALKRSKEACWTCRSSPPLSFSHQVSYCLEKAIFQDLLLELIHNNSPYQHM